MALGWMRMRRYVEIFVRSEKKKRKNNFEEEGGNSWKVEEKKEKFRQYWSRVVSLPETCRASVSSDQPGPRATVPRSKSFPELAIVSIDPGITADATRQAQVTRFLHCQLLWFRAASMTIADV